MPEAPVPAGFWSREQQRESRERFLEILHALKEKDQEVSFNTDSIAGSEQAIAFTPPGRIIVSCKQDKIIISQDGNDDIVFDAKLASEAEQALTNIVEQY